MQIKYAEIKDRLVEKSRREQYQILLATEEWQTFRQHLLDVNSNTCEICKKPAETVIQMSDEEKAEYSAEYNKQMSEFERRKKNFSVDEWMATLLDGTYVGQPLRVVESETILTIFHIHHKLYFQNKLPWQYARNHLQILCQDCHKEVHSTTAIYTYQDERMQYRKEEISCAKCAGTGFLPEYYYRDNGICYDCGGLGLLDNGKQHWVLAG